MTNVLGTATSGLIAFQTALATTGHNIANANTPGYTRQRALLATQPGQATGVGFIGSGVNIGAVERVYNQFLVESIRAGASNASQFETYFSYASRVDNTLGDENSGLSGGLQNFFNALQGVADDPTSSAAREVLLSDSELLVARFQYLENQLDNLEKEVNGQLEATVNEINSLASAIADVNEEIVRAMGASGGASPNDLLDTRDALIQDLSELVNVTTLEQDNGAVNVFIGKGQSLVTNFTAQSLSVTGNSFDASHKEIAYGSGPVITESMTGGQLGGLLDFRDEVLIPSQNSLGRIATTLAYEMNQQHALGMDLNGNLGGDFFNLGSPEVTANGNNTGSGTVSVSYDTANMSDLTINDYILDYDGAAWSLSNAATGASVAMTGSGTGADPFIVDGMSIVVGGSPDADDRFLLEPNANGVGGLSLAITDINEIAAAGPVRIGEAVDANGLPTNGGSGAFALDSVDANFSALSAGIDFTFDAATNEFTYSGDVSGTISYDPSTDSGTSFTVAGISFTVTGTPSDGDEFNIVANANGAGDNTNALALAGLQTGLTMDGGSSSFEDAYAELVADIGIRTRQSEINADSQGGLLRQQQATLASISGVNLDEEAANLLRYQEAYQAMAQVVTTADTMFQTLLSAVGR